MPATRSVTPCAPPEFRPVRLVSPKLERQGPVVSRTNQRRVAPVLSTISGRSNSERNRSQRHSSSKRSESNTAEAKEKEASAKWGLVQAIFLPSETSSYDLSSPSSQRLPPGSKSVNWSETEAELRASERPAELLDAPEADLALSYLDDLKIGPAKPAGICTRNCLIHPHAPWMPYWAALVGILLVSNLILVPAVLVFERNEENQLSNLSLVIVLSINDLVFVIDAIFNFRLGYVETGLPGQPSTVVMDGKEIACRYLRFWFWIDVISVFPFDLVLRVTIDSSTAGSIVLVRSLRLLRLLRLLKTLRIKRYFNSWLSEGRAVMHPTAWRLARGGAWLVLLAHLVACGAFGVCRAEGFPSDSWATLQGLEPGSGASWSEQYVASLYWALMTITTVGYGDISMARTAERLYAISCMLLGAVFFAYIVSSLSQLVREMDANNVLMRQRMDSINSYMHYRRLPLELRGRIRRYFTFFWSRQSIFDEQALLASLPAHLRRETALYLHKDMISKVPFLKEADNCFISSLVMELMPVQASPGDFLMIVGEVGMDMQFIDFGRVQIWAADMTILYRTLGPGDYFGEIALLTRERRTANCKAVTHVELWSLSRESLARLFADSPEMEQKLEQMARQRLALQMRMALESKLAKEPAQERAPNVEEASEESRSPLYPTDENLNHNSAGAAEAQSNGTEKVNETMIRALKKLQSRRMLQQTLQQMQQDDFDADNDREFLSAGTSARSFVRPAHGASLGGSHSASRGVTPERVRRPSICSFGPTPSIHSADNDRAFCNSTIGSAPMGGTTPSRVRMTLPDPTADDLDGGIFSTLHKKQLRHAMSNHALDADARDDIEETLHGLQAQQRQTAESVKTMLNVCARLEKAVAALTESRLADEQRKAVGPGSASSFS